MGVDSDKTIRSIEIKGDIDGGFEEVVDDYYFEKIGKPIPIVSDSEGSTIFDLQSPPTRPLAISEVHSLIFVAHSSGFLVARTKDVMDSAKEAEDKGTKCSVEELSIASVSVGKVHILSLSSDSSTLAACVAADVHFFAVDSLVKNDIKPLFSCSLNESSATIKDMHWRRRQDTSYLVLSNHGKLSLGALGSPLKDVMDGVDAVDWSVKGKYIALARENNLHIFSSKFKEKSRISLPLKLWIGDSDDNCSVKVDSIRWICPDNIVLGCFQQLEDGKEENYLIQVIKSKDGRITDASSKLSAVSLHDVYSGLIDDIMPHGSGPYLLLSYLQQCGIAITANRKNADIPIALLHWPLQDDTSEVAFIDIARDSWVPRIGVQGNGDDNLILGLCVDNVSVHGKVRVEEKELSPSCALFYVTLEGMLAIHYFASASEPTVSPEADSSLCDEEEDSDVAAGNGQLIPFNMGEQTFDQVALGSQMKDMSKREPNVSEDNINLAKTGVIHSGKSENSVTAVVPDIFCKDAISKKQDMESLFNTKASVADGNEKVAVSELYQGVGGHGIDAFVQQETTLEQLSLKNLLKHPSKAEADEITEFQHAPIASLEKGSTFPSQSMGKDLEKSLDLPKPSVNSITSTSSQKSAYQLGSFGKPILSSGSDNRPLFSSSSSQGIKFDNDGNSFGTRFVASHLAGKPVPPKNSIGESPSSNFSVRQTQIVGPKASVSAGKIEPLPSIRSSQLASQETSDFGRQANYRSLTSNDSHRALSASSSEPHLSRQLGNIKEMTSELDALLESIEKPGGFRDVCTVSKRSLIEALEEQMQTLSGRCQMWKSLMDKQLGETQNLLDKTVQVLARKIYMDGIVKQAIDSKYWELWNRQKLNSEFELKRRHILKLNQVLTNQLIELERHFNTLELHKFGENGGAHTGRRTLHSRYEPSRQIQSLHSLHNTTNSQVAAAEQLSECLTKQMEVLSIQSPVEPKNVKQELFESIGISYDPTFSSPATSKVHDSSSLKKLLVSGSAINKSQSRRRLSSAMKSSDSETARRRESLDESWTSFEPTKTTIKRVLLQESQKTDMNTLSLKGRDQLDHSFVDKSARLTSPSFTNQFGNSGIQRTPPEKGFGTKSNPSSWGNDSLSGHKVPFGKPGNLFMNETRSCQQSEAVSHKKSFFSTESPAQLPVLTKTITTDTKIAFTKSPSKGYESSFSLQTSAAPAVPSHFGEAPHFNVPASKSQPTGKSSPGFSMSLSFPSSPMMNSSSSTASSGFNLSSSSPSISAAMPFGMSTGSSKTGTVVSLTPSSASSSSSSVFSSSSFSLQSGSSKMQSPVDTTRLLSMSESLKTQVQLPTANTSQTPTASSSDSFKPLEPATVKPPSSAESTSIVEIQPPKEQVQHSANKVSAKTDVDIDKTDGPPGFSLKIEPPVSSTSRTETSTAFKIEPPASSAPRTETSTPGSGSQLSSNSITRPETGLGLNMQPKLAPDAHALFNASQPSDIFAGGKSVNLDVPAGIEEEDEMEEVAPETNQTNEISLGSLGGFGLGSTPSANVPKANPFGGPFGNVGTNQASSAFSMTVPSGELFRPASFSFQPIQPAQPSPPTSFGAASGDFGAGAVGQAPAPTFGQPAQIGAGQQALGSVLGSFGQSRQFGTGLPGGFATSSMGGFSSAPAVGGFATAASAKGGFASLASAGGGFGAAASGGGGFAGAASGGGGFGAPAGGGFGAFSSQPGFSAFGGNSGGNQQGVGGFSAFGGSGKPPELFTQMRK